MEEWLMLDRIRALRHSDPHDDGADVDDYSTPSAGFMPYEDVRDQFGFIPDRPDQDSFKEERG
jgi:hypothetical protein